MDCYFCGNDWAEHSRADLIRDFVLEVFVGDDVQLQAPYAENAYTETGGTIEYQAVVTVTVPTFTRWLSEQNEAHTDDRDPRWLDSDDARDRRDDR